MATKLGRMVTYLDGLLLIKACDPISPDLARSNDKLKLLYLQRHSAYGHQTGQDGDLH